MAEQMRPASPQQAPDPANSYERAKPENENGMGRLDKDKALPQDKPDRMEDAVSHRQPNRDGGAEDAVNQRGGPAGGESLRQPDHSMKDEDPLDEGPNDISNPRAKRHPRKEGRGGTP